MMNFSIGLSTLQTAQFAIQTASQNVANASTVGYHRQRVILDARAPQWMHNQQIGSGVNISRVDRIRSHILESSYTQSVSELNGLRENLSMLRQIESEFLLGDGSIYQAVNGFFGEMTRLSANPNERVARDAVIHQATQIARQANGMSNRLLDMKTQIEVQLRSDVATLNRELAELVNLQHQIQTVSFQGAVANDLLDRRDRLINTIAEKIDLERFEGGNQGLGLSIGGSSITIGSTPPSFDLVTTPDGKLSIVMAGSNQDVRFQSGSIAAMQENFNVTIGQYQARLNEFVSTFIREVDQAHAKGVGLNGPFTLLRSARMAMPPTAPLQNTNLPFPVSAGQLTVSITNPQGEKRTHSIEINPATDSLSEIANKLDGINNLRAVVDPRSGQLSLFASSGYSFDFTGNLETIPGLETFSGTSIPQISGQYIGDRNRNLEVTIVGSGTVGSTPGLIARVTDLETGAVIIDLPIGKGYEAGQPLNVMDGVSLSFQSGSVGDGDSFRTPLIQESDSTGILSALGLNSFFTGSNASDIQVASRILNNPNEFASSRTGDLSDTSNLLGLIGLKGKQLVGDLKMTFHDYLGDISSTIGFEVKLQHRFELNIKGLNEHYAREIDAISGVDLNEELLTINQFQKQYEAAVQVLRAIDSMMAELMNIVR
jgi:flagellar hook-associated protein 1